MNNQELETMARDLIAKKLAHGDEVQMTWAVKELIDGAGEISGDGVNFYSFCTREHIYRIVKKAVEKYEQAGDENDDEKQMKMVGFEYLQVAYTVLRNDQRVLVPIDCIADLQLLARATEYDAQAEGYKAHAREIRRYVAQRVNPSKTATAEGSGMV